MSAQKLSSIFLAAAVVLSCIAIGLSLYFQNQGEESLAHASPSSSASAISGEQGYLLQEYQGHLALFQKGSDTPLEEYEVSVAQFSDYDQALLKKGVYAQTEEELRKMVEDYTS